MIVHVTIGDRKLPFDTQKHKSLLDFLEDSGEKVYSQCREGFCGCCAVQTQDADKFMLTMNENDVIGSYDKESEVLACSCLPIDDVSLKM